MSDHRGYPVKLLPDVTAPDRAARDPADRALAGRIRHVHAGSDGTYGAPPITAELRDSGRPMNHKRVAGRARFIRSAGRRRRTQTVSDQIEHSAGLFG